MSQQPEARVIAEMRSATTSSPAMTDALKRWADTLERAQVERLQAAGQVVAYEYNNGISDARILVHRKPVDLQPGEVARPLVYGDAPAQEAADTGADERELLNDLHASDCRDAAAWLRALADRIESICIGAGSPDKHRAIARLLDRAALAASTGANVDAGMVPKLVRPKCNYLSAPGRICRKCSADHGEVT